MTVDAGNTVDLMEPVEKVCTLCRQTKPIDSANTNDPRLSAPENPHGSRETSCAQQGSGA